MSADGRYLRVPYSMRCCTCDKCGWPRVLSATAPAREPGPAEAASPLASTRPGNSRLRIRTSPTFSSASNTWPPGCHDGYVEALGGTVDVVARVGDWTVKVE